ncbi:hypothetical protein FOCC_FOCC001542, partial [Frankliniella occidentalis]
MIHHEHHHEDHRPGLPARRSAAVQSGDTPGCPSGIYQHFGGARRSRPSQVRHGDRRHAVQGCARVDLHLRGAGTEGPVAAALHPVPHLRRHHWRRRLRASGYGCRAEVSLKNRPPTTPGASMPILATITLSCFSLL